MLSVDATEGFSAGLEEVPVALAGLRARLMHLAGRLEAHDWEQPSRCHLWTVHDVVRHVRDGCRRHVARLRGDAVSAFVEPFDARRTPSRWLEQSAGQAPSQTIAELQALSDEEAEALRRRLVDSRDEVVSGPYGPVHWAVLSTHVFWDAWLHERDVAVPLGLETHPTLAEEGVVALYSLLIASMPAVLREHPFEVSVALTSDGRRYVASVAPGRVTLRLGQASDGEDLHGDLVPVVDALAGRGATLEDVLHGDPAVREPFTWLRTILGPGE